MRTHSTKSTPMPRTLINLLNSQPIPSTRESDARTRSHSKSFAKPISRVRNSREAPLVRGVFAPVSLLDRTSSGIIRHRGEHFFYGSFQSDPHRARNDGMTDVELG